MKMLNHSFKNNQSPPRHICKKKLGSYVLSTSLLKITQTSFWDDGDLLILFIACFCFPKTPGSTRGLGKQTPQGAPEAPT